MTGPKISSRAMRHAVGHVGEDGRLRRRSRPRSPAARTRSPPVSSRAPSAGRRRCSRCTFSPCAAEISGPIWVASSSGSPRTIALGALDEPVEEARRARPRCDEDAGAVGADLPGGVEVAEHRAADGAVEVGVVEDDQRRLAAELQRHVLQAVGGRRHRPWGRSPTEPVTETLAMPGCADQRRADRARALDHVEDAVGQAGLGEDLAELQGAERGQLGRLEDHGVAAGERRGRLPAGDLAGVVPGADADADPERLAPGIDEVAAEIDRARR